jgi:hypothetical protein
MHPSIKRALLDAMQNQDSPERFVSFGFELIFRFLSYLLAFSRVTLANDLARAATSMFADAKVMAEVKDNLTSDSVNLANISYPYFQYVLFVFPFSLSLFFTSIFLYSQT